MFPFDDVMMMLANGLKINNIATVKLGDNILHNDWKSANCYTY